MIPRFLLVTGTDTGVGKTIATAALAATLRAAGRRVIMCKPIQTGHISPDDPQREHLEADYSDVVTESDAQIVARLTGIHTFTNITLRLPMAPLPAARLEATGSVSATAGAASILPSAAEHAQLIATVAERTRADHVLIEGSGECSSTSEATPLPTSSPAFRPTQTPSVPSSSPARAWAH